MFYCTGFEVYATQSFTTEDIIWLSNWASEKIYLFPTIPLDQVEKIKQTNTLSLLKNA